MQFVADRLAVAFENQRLFDATQTTLLQVEGQTRRLDLLNQLAIKLGQTSDEQSAFRAVASSLSQILGSDRSSLGLYDSAMSQVEIVALDGEHGSIPTGSFLPLEGTAIGQVLETKQLFSCDDMSKTPFRDIEALSKDGLCSCMIAPLWAAPRQILGTLNVAVKHYNAYSTEHGHLMLQISSLFATTLENRQLLTQLQLGLEETGRRYRASHQLNVTTNLQEILETVNTLIDADGNGHASLCTFELNQEGVPEWAEFIAASKGAKVPLGTRFFLPDFPATKLWLTHTDNPVFVSDISTDDRIDTQTKQFFTGINAQSFLVMPLKSNQEWGGIIHVTWAKPQEFSETRVSFIRSILPQTSIIIRNQLLYQAAQQNEEELNLVSDYAPNAIVLLNMVTQQFEYGNAKTESLFGISRSELSHIRPVDISPTYQPDGRLSETRFAELIRATLKSDTAEFEWTYLNQTTNEEISCETHWIALPGERKHLLRGNIIDVRQKKQTQAALADLLKETEAQTKRLSILNELAVGLSQIQTVEDAFRLVARKTKEIIGTDRVSMSLVNTEGKLELYALHGVEGAMPLGITFPLDDTTMIGTVVLTKSPVTILNTAENSWSDVQALHNMGLQATLDVPLVTSGQAIGTLNTAAAEAKYYDSNAETLLLQIASILATTLENRNLLDQTVEAKERAEIANQAKSIFLANMSHELRTPLNAILGYAQILGRDSNLSDQQQQGLSTIYQSGEYLLTLINDVLDLSKVEAGKMELRPTNFHFETFLNGITAVIRSDARAKRLRFIVDLDKSLPANVEGDETRLRQILLNLLGNAVKFTHNGHIRFHVHSLSITSPDPDNQAGQMLLRFEIEDTGIGIDTAQLETIFYPFEQLGKQQDRMKGVGLGLPISHQLVSLMGGEIHVTSQPGKGSVFWFELDLPFTGIDEIYHNADTSPIIGYERSDSTNPHEPIKILVADDVAENRTMIIDMLRPLGFDLFEAQNGDACIQQAELLKPDLILMDNIMPVLDGLTATTQIRQMPDLEDIVIIIVSASAFEQDREDSLAAGANAFLSKPVYLDHLLTTISAHLDIVWQHTVADQGPRDQSNTNQAITDEAMIPPSLAELRILYQLASLGDMERLQERVTFLSELDVSYTSFAYNLNILAKQDAQQEILGFLEQYLIPS
ncbi:MAG: GAF domain-containing protein [Chloroflexota bacterium]